MHNNRELNYLTVLRAFAAIWVGLHHCATTLKLGEDSIFSSVFFARGWLGVDLFFILSGFILSYSYQGKLKTLDLGALKDFWIKRFARVYPAHLFVLGLYVALIYGTLFLGLFQDPQNRFNGQELFAQLFLVHGIGFFEPRAWNIPSWSISSEVLAYLLFPLILLPLRKVQGKFFNVLLIFSILSITVALAGVMNDGQKFMLDFEFTWVRILSEFAMGMALYQFTANFRPHRAYSFLALLMGACLYGQSNIANHFYDFMFLVYFMVLIHSLALVPRDTRIPVLSTLGETSYAFYLVHSLVLIGLNQLAGRFDFLVQYSGINVALFILLSQLAAWSIYRAVETPGRKLVRDLFAETTPSPSRDSGPGSLQDRPELGT